MKVLRFRNHLPLRSMPFCKLSQYTWRLARILALLVYNVDNVVQVPQRSRHRSALSPTFWLYWAVLIPVTVVVVAIWYLWKRRGRKKRCDEDPMEQGVGTGRVKVNIMANMRQERV